MRFRSLVALASATAALTACQGLREALTAHVDVAARAGGQELSVTRLADLLGGSRLQIPVTPQNAQLITQLWVDYQLLGTAAARGDTAVDKKALQEAAAGLFAGMRLKQYMDSVDKTFTGDSGTEASYAQGAGDLFAARHILLGHQNMTPQEKDSVAKLAAQVRAQTTDANFGQMVAKYSTEPGAAQRGGNLGVFRKGDMIPAFSNAVAALKPGEISQPIETNFGFHIIQRLPYAAVKPQYAAAYSQISRQHAESTWLAQVEQKGQVKIKDDAPKSIKSALKDPAEHRTDKTVIATYDGGDVTIARMLQWVNSSPNSSEIARQIQTAPDSLVKDFAQAVVRQELLLREADRAGVKLPPDQEQQFYANYDQFIHRLWQQLGVEPKSLADSAKSESERERLAAARVESYVDRLVNGQAQPIMVPSLVESVLQEKYESKINDKGIERAVEKATKVRASADSTRNAQQPASQVPLPMPGAPGAPGAGAGAGQPPAGAQPPAGGAPQGQH